MSNDNVWDTMLEYLRVRAESISEVADGVCVHREPGEGRERIVHIHITPTQWADYVAIPHGSIIRACAALWSDIEAVPASMTHLLFKDYDFVASADPSNSENTDEWPPPEVEGQYRWKA